MVSKRSPIMVIVYMMCTCGLYGIFWFYWTKQELNGLGAKIPTYWLMCIPIVNFYWLWKYFEGFEQVVKTQTALILLVVSLIFSPLAIYWVQDGLNGIADKKPTK